MKEVISYSLITIGIIIYGICKFYKEIILKNKQNLKDNDDLSIVINETIEEDIFEKPEDLYDLQTDEVKFWLYKVNFDFLDELGFLYKLIIHKNLWINEPFHTKFYEFLLLFKDNEFMIVDLNSKVISMKLRDKNNKMQSSKSYQVFSTKEVVHHVIVHSIDYIKKFNQRDAQNIIISIFVILLEKSTYYLSREITQNIVNKLLNNYQYTKDVIETIRLIKTSEQKLFFIQKSVNDAFRTLQTYPYNDTETPKLVQLREKLPPKLLQKI